MFDHLSLPKPFFVLAPMDDVTDTVFRRIVGNCAAPDMYFTEFVNVDGLQSPGRARVIRKLQKTSDEQPVIAQIWGKNPDNFYKTAAELVEMGFAGVDINMGCPEKSVVHNGSCSALINDRPLASEMIKATQAGVSGKLPVSVKTRLGFNVVDLSWHEFLLGHKLDMLTVHGRTRKEMSDVPAHWDIIGQVRQLRDRLEPVNEAISQPGDAKANRHRTLIVGNGDITSRRLGLELAEQYQLDGVMIGRGVFHDPYIFAQQSPWPETAPAERIALYRRQVQLFADSWQPGERNVFTLNRFCKVYINGFDGAKEMREQLMTAGSTEELARLLDNFAAQV